MSQIATPPVPELPSANNEYNRELSNQTNGLLRTFFIRLRAAMSTLLGSKGGANLNNPYGAFADTSDQTAAANTATVIVFNTTDYANGVSVVTSGGKASRLTVTDAGIYNLQFSVQVENTNNAIHDMSIWLRKNGTDIVGSTGLIGLQARKSATDFYHNIVGWNYFLSLVENDYVEIWFSVDSTAVSIQAYAAGTSPTRPSTASVVATMSFVSNS